MWYVTNSWFVVIELCVLDNDDQFVILCGADGRRVSKRKRLNVMKRLDGDIIPVVADSGKTNTQPYGVSSPFSLPPFDSLGPIPLPENSPPFCIYPPGVPTNPVGMLPPYNFPPIFPIQSPPPPSPIGVVPGPPEYNPNPNPPVIFPSPNPNPNPPEIVPSPIIIVPGPPEFTPSPPSLSPPYYEPSPPYYEPSPGGIVPSPPSYVPTPHGPGGFVPSPPSYVPTPRGPDGSIPSPPIFQPPVVFPPPTVPPPPYRGPKYSLWCVAKPSVPEPIIEEAMNYACGSGADCTSIQPNGPCFQPNTLLSHASYAFNSYWQRTKVAGGTCEFGGTAILVTIDPSKFEI